MRTRAGFLAGIAVVFAIVVLEGAAINPRARAIARVIDQIIALPELDRGNIEKVLGMKAELTATVKDFRRDYRLVGKHPFVTGGEVRWNHQSRNGLVILEIDHEKSVTEPELRPLLKKFGRVRIVPPSSHAPAEVAVTAFVFDVSVGELWLAFPGFPPRDSARLKSIMIDQFPGTGQR